MTDDFALEGSHVGYVPCEELPGAIDADEEGAVYGIGSGFVAADEEAAALPAEERAAIVGSGMGFVPKPCECVDEAMGLSETMSDLDSSLGNRGYYVRASDGWIIADAKGIPGLSSGYPAASQTSAPTSVVFVGHVPPVGATKGRFRSRLMAVKIGATTGGTVDWQIRAGVFDYVATGIGNNPRSPNANDPAFASWDSGAILASGQLPILDNGPPGAGEYDDVDVLVPLDVDGRFKLTFVALNASFECFFHKLHPTTFESVEIAGDVPSVAAGGYLIDWYSCE